jgi:hypothetical protein
MPKLQKTFKIKGGLPNFFSSLWGPVVEKREVNSITEPKTSEPNEVEYKPSDEVIGRNVNERLYEIQTQLQEVLPENEKKFQEYVEHEWKLCKTHKGFNNRFKGKITTRDFEDFKSRINTDPSYDTRDFTDEDYNRLYIRCSSENKEDFSKKLRETDEGKFILNPRTGGKRNKTKKNKRKSKTQKKGRK